MVQTSRTPKLFGSSYQPPPSNSTSSGPSAPWRAIIIIVLAAALVLLLGRLPIFRLKTVELLGDKNDTISTQSNNLLGQSIFSHAVTQFISETKSNITVSGFNCSRGIPNILRCTLKTRSASLVWESDGTDYLVDDTGTIFELGSLPPPPNTLVVVDTKKQVVHLGSVVGSPDMIKQYQHLTDLLNSKQLTVSKLLLDESLYQVSAAIERVGKPTIQASFLLSGDLNAQVEALSGALTQKGDSITERVDLRVPGYVFTK